MLTDSIGRIRDGFDRMKNDVPLKIGNMGTNFWRQAFERQGFVDKNRQQWKTPQRLIPGTQAYKYPKRNAATRHARAILVQSGKLRAAVASSLITHTWDNISWQVTLPYAKAHNDGLGNMPKRRFIGHSDVFLKMVKDKIISELKKLHTK